MKSRLQLIKHASNQLCCSSMDVLQMSDVGHFVMIEDPETFNRLLSEVIEEFTADLDN